MNDAYRAAGVDIEAGYKAVQLMKEHVKKTTIPGVLSPIGGFGGLFAPDIIGMEEPVLVSGTDGVGTKLKIAFLMDKHDTVGQDCVAMCVNDIVCSGARPLFFLDYVAVGKNKPEKVASIVKGVADGCVLAGCALIGGETAEMPGFYPEEEYDLAGFAVGIVDKKKIIDGSKLCAGDVLLGLGSSGVHSNGFSLVRKALAVEEGDAVFQHVEALGTTLGEALLAPTRIYAKSILALCEQVEVKAISHITGGGFIENVPRMMREGLTAVIDKASYPIPPIFDHIRKAGNVPMDNMYNTFNMGIGMIAAVSKAEAQTAMHILRAQGEDVYEIGVVENGSSGVRLI
ncbi:MAG: phosphoribosylformylglycinamidine cyclo-ligase [Clostridia bacterium]|nr:phosphoribosylformylglycinamidine cyclo-ligase [Clostridia bacterium]